MASIAIVFASRYGHTKAVADYVLRGINAVAGVTGTLINVTELAAPDREKGYIGRWTELNAADAIIFGSPTYMGNIASEMKAFMEHSSALWMKQAWKDKLAGGFSNSGALSGDKLHSLTSMIVFASQHSMLWVSQGVMPSIYRPEQAPNINRVGAWLGVMTQSDQAPPNEAPPDSDRTTAQMFGERFAKATLRWTAGANR